MGYFNTPWFNLKSVESRLVSGTVIGIFFIFCPTLYAQEIPIQINTFKTALPDNGVGDWNDPATWEVWNGTAWTPTLVFPERNNDVFIEQLNEVRLSGNQEVRNLYLFSTAMTTRKLNLQNHNLDVYGALRCFTDSAGIFVLAGATSLETDWIYPESGNIVFKGNSRTIVDRVSWSASNLRSRFGVIFNPDPGDTLTVNAAFKANRFTIQSGTVFQTVNSQGAEATSTFSFNTQDFFGMGAFGEFVIEAGATLISAGTGEFGEIIMRSISDPAASFHLKEGGTLVLYGEEPVIEAENIRLEGNVHYNGELGSQQFISANKVLINNIYNNIFFDGNAQKVLPGFLELLGDITFLGGGEVIGNITSMVISGVGDQEISNLSLELISLQIQKSFGILSIDGNLSIQKDFTMVEGLVDFLGNQLHINNSGEGSYAYHKGSWRNLGQLNYLRLPPVLDQQNTTFPFEDQLLGGIRSIYLSGINSSGDANLGIVYTQLPGVNWDPGFDDDGIPILYKVNSYFTFDLTSSTPLTDPVEMYIAADSLIVITEMDLRIVGNGSAAPGEHLDGLGGDDFFAGRSLSLNDLNTSQTFTIGSTGITSILPIRWLSYAAEELVTGNLISWSSSQEVENARFIILKSTPDGMDFEEVAEVLARENTNKIQHYQFLEKSFNGFGNVFYQIKYEDLDGGVNHSPVFSLQRSLDKSLNLVRIFPNPYSGGQMTFLVPENQKNRNSLIQLLAVSGVKILEKKGQMEEAVQIVINELEELAPGIYLIVIDTDSERQILKWLKY